MTRRLLAVLLPLLALQPVSAELVVAADGTGDFGTVQAAFDAIPKDHPEWLTVRIRPGVYREKLALRNARQVRLLGEDPETTILTWHDSARSIGPDGHELGTGGSASVTLRGRDVLLENLTFENTAGPGQQVAQAIAAEVSVDRAVLRNCRFLGYQDTLYAGSGRQYYDRCLIRGDADFIFGNAAAWFEGCRIDCVGYGWITAQSRASEEQQTGFLFHGCTVGGSAKPGEVRLGRPWRPYALVAFLGCNIGEVVAPVGWTWWTKDDPLEHVWFAEHGNTGPGAATDQRVAWSHQLTDDEAAALTPAALLGGDDGWTGWRG